ncbi:MAG: hypothetical protein R3B90_19025 [Planctomycetaceae bacterium]
MPADHAGEATVSAGGGVLATGAKVRIIRDPWFGAIGTVAEMPAEPQRLDSGSKARVLVVERGDGERVTVPRANVELVSL